MQNTKTVVQQPIFTPSIPSSCIRAPTPLRLHPVSGLSAEFPTPQRGFMGPMMTTLVDQFANMDGEGYGVRLEMAPVHPGLGATSLPWAGGREWKRSLARFRCAGYLAVR